MKYYLIVGEPSGDLHGANLMKGLLKADPQAEFRFWGGDKMAAVGGADNLVMHYRQTSFFGIFNVLKNLRTIGRQLRMCQADIAAWNPDVVILVDYPGFNMKIARWAHEAGFRVHYYIAPKVWAWKEWRVKQIQKYVDQLYIIFPFEKEYFSKFGIEPVFCGNPLVDDVAERRAMLPSPEVFRTENGLDERPIVALLAGSRASEIKANLPNMVVLAKRFPDYQFIVAAVSWLDKALYERYLQGSEVRYLCDKTQQTLAMSEAAVVTSGTATLETALMGIPEMVLFHIPKFAEVLRPYVLKIPWVSLVNINMNREVVCELVSAKFDLEKAAAELKSILVGGAKREKMLCDFDELRAIIGDKGASDRFAQEMVQTLQEKKK